MKAQKQGDTDKVNGTSSAVSTKRSISPIRFESTIEESRAKKKSGRPAKDLYSPPGGMFSKGIGLVPAVSGRGRGQGRGRGRGQMRGRGWW